MTSVLAYGAYIPAGRLARHAISEALAAPHGRGVRSVASYDEDTTSLAVEAGLIAVQDPTIVRRVYSSTSSPAYLDKTNATAAQTALGVGRDVMAVDFGGAPRSATGAFLAAADGSIPTLVLMSDIRTGLPGGDDESAGGDGAAAFLIGEPDADHPALARILTSASTSEEFLERWRIPGARSSRVWEERFVESVYEPLARDSFGAALSASGLAPASVDHLIVTGLSARAVRSFIRRSGVDKARVARDLSDEIGNAGSAQPGILLADTLDRAQPGDIVALVHLADGVTTILLEVSPGIRSFRPLRTVDDQLAAPSKSVSYADFLTWRGMLDREPPRRPEPDAAAAPPSLRSSEYKFAFQATRCRNCGTVNVPPSRVCYACRTVDEMDDYPLSRIRGTVVTLTVDRLAFTPSPPMLAAVVDFDNGGRFRCEIADALPEDIEIGTKVELTFRRLLTSQGVHNYFWKARPVANVERTS